MIAVIEAYRGVGVTAQVQSWEDTLKCGGYLPSDEIVLMVGLAAALNRPLLLEGPSGSGKTALAYAVARGMGREVIRLSCYEGLGASEALYDWNYNAQWAKLAADRAADPFQDEFLLARPLLQAIENPDSILLIDEVDRADEAFEALLLEFLSEFQISIPERGTRRASHPPITILTSNRQRPLSDALRRRCLYLFLDWPDETRENAVVRYHVEHIPEHIQKGLVRTVRMLRTWNLIKPPGLSEAIDWALAAELMEVTEWSRDWIEKTLGIIIKDALDLQRVRERVEELAKPET